MRSLHGSKLWLGADRWKHLRFQKMLLKIKKIFKYSFWHLLDSQLQLGPRPIFSFKKIQLELKKKLRQTQNWHFLHNLLTLEFWNRYLKVHQYEGLFHHVYSTVKGKQHLNYGSMHSQHLLDESQQWKHKKNTLNRFLCSHCRLWTSKCHIGVVSKNGYDLCYLRRNRFVLKVKRKT